MYSRRLANLRPVPGETTPAGRRRALLLGALLCTLTLACDQADPTGPAQPSLVKAATTESTFDCPELAPVSVTKTVAPGTWDTLRAGPHLLIFQPGSLSTPVKISATIAKAKVRAIEFGPEGLEFKRGYLPILRMHVANCRGVSDSLEIVHTTGDVTKVKEVLASSVDLRKATVSARLRHFSKYVVRSRYAVHY